MAAPSIVAFALDSWSMVALPDHQRDRSDQDQGRS